eukprot:m.80246 g.80246  ORF g.80246 m.80246 type:complete len:816 (+) comp9337_c0_seq1:292-2739(+)
MDSVSDVPDEQVDAFLALCERISGTAHDAPAAPNAPPPPLPVHASYEAAAAAAAVAAATAAPRSAHPAAPQPKPRPGKSQAVSEPLIVRPPTLFLEDGDEGSGVVRAAPVPRRRSTGSGKTTGSGQSAASATPVMLPPPPVDVDVAADTNSTVDAAGVKARSVDAHETFHALLDMFPGRHHGDLYAIAGSAASLDDAIAKVIDTQTLDTLQDIDADLPPPVDEHVAMDAATSRDGPLGYIPEDPTSDAGPARYNGGAVTSWLDQPPPVFEQPSPRHASHRYSVGSIMSVTSVDTDAGFARCPPPSDAVLNSARPPVTLPPPDTSYPTQTHQQTSTTRQTPPNDSPVAQRRPIQVATSSGEFSGFDGTDTDADGQADVSAAQHRAHRDDQVAAATADLANLLPAGSNAELRRAVEDLVERRLRRPTSGTSDDDSVSSSGVRVSEEALSRIVAETVDRMLRDRQDNDTPRHSTLSTGSNHTVVGGTPRESAAYDDPPDNRPPSHPSDPHRGGASRLGRTGRDARYIAGNATLEQLLPQPVKTVNPRDVALSRIHRLRTGQGAPITGHRIVVERDPHQGFGFVIAGDSPVYVSSVTANGPCDLGADGLMSGDVILKVGSVPCARATHATVRDLVDSKDVGDYLDVVVARTPPPQRKDVQRSDGPTGSDGRGSGERGTLQSGSPQRSSRSRRGSGRRHSRSAGTVAGFSGWLSVLATKSNRMSWTRYWFVLGEGILSFYDGPDDTATPHPKPQGTMSLEETSCTWCSAADRIKRDFAFKIEHESQPPLYLCGPNKPNVDEWIKHINRAADEASLYGFDV